MNGEYKMKNTYGGGSKTNENGLGFEKKVDIKEAINNQSLYNVNGNTIELNGTFIGEIYEKYSLYKNLIEPVYGIDYKTRISKRLLPDSAVLVDNVLYIIEKKFQEQAGSVDEKLQTCDFKKSQYERLFKGTGITIEFYYVLSEWFKSPQYIDVFSYIERVGCKYFIVDLPLEEIGLKVKRLPHLLT